jgi:DNA-nicking Smr family endonuclease
VCVQFIAFKHNKPFRFKNPCSVELRVDTVKFYKLHSFQENDYFDDNALVYYIIRNDIPERELLVSAGDIEQAMKEKQQTDRRPRIQRIEKKEKNPIIEVDLHINQLLDTTTGMSNEAILEYQLSKFHEVMNENLNKKNQKIVFIHGKGNGVLKSAIVKELKNKYKKCYFQDASFREYGFGATMVTIH